MGCSGQDRSEQQGKTKRWRKGKEKEELKGGGSRKEAVPSSIRGEAQTGSLGTAGGWSPARL